MFCYFLDLVLECIVKTLFPEVTSVTVLHALSMSVDSSFICNIVTCYSLYSILGSPNILVVYLLFKYEVRTIQKGILRSVTSSCPSHPIPIFFSPISCLLPVGNETYLFLIHPSCVYMCVLYKWADTCILAHFPFFLTWKGGYHRYHFMLWSFHLTVYPSLQKSVNVTGLAVILRNASLQGLPCQQLGN